VKSVIHYRYISTAVTVIIRVIYKISLYLGHVVAQLVKELHYKPEIIGLIPDGVIGIFH
jgi:hypothetical protein